MNDQPRPATRREELDALVDAHLSAGSLDEANASTFDRLIDAWLQEELALLDIAAHERAQDEAERACRQQAEQARANEERHQAEARANEERHQAEARAESGRLEREQLQQRQEAVQEPKARLAEARRKRRDRRLADAERRLAAATARFQHAERRLLGEVVAVEAAPLSSDVPEPDDHDTDEKVA
jgi:hypothetical protein